MKQNIKIAKELIKIARQVLSYSGYIRPINRYMDMITDQVMNYVQDGQLQSNLLIKIGIKNPNEIKDNMVRHDYFTISIYSPDLNTNSYKSCYLDCLSGAKTNNDMFLKCDYDQGFTNDNHIHLGVSIGLTEDQEKSFEQLWNKYYEDTLQHELTHVFELYFGYKNKKLNYNDIDGDEYQQSFHSFDLDNPQYDFNWEVGYYYNNDIQFTPYLVNLISLFKKLYESGIEKRYLIKMINSVNFNDVDDVKQFCNDIMEKGFQNDSPIKWFYHLSKRDTNLFNEAKKKLIKAIWRF